MRTPLQRLPVRGWRFLALSLLVGLAGGGPLPVALGQVNGLPAQQNPGALRPGPAVLENVPPPANTRETSPEIHLDTEHLGLPRARSAPERDNAESQALSFWVGNVRVAGSRLFSPESWQTLSAPYIGRRQTLGSLTPLLDEMTRHYRDKGYLTTEVYIPPQDLANGTLIIQVREGSVGKIAIDGNRFYRAHVIRRALRQQAGEPLNFRVLEKDLNRLNRLNAGYQVKAYLGAGAQPGETDIRLKVAERQPLQITPTFDNQGRPFIGFYRTGMEVRHDSLLGLGDHFDARWLGAAHTQIAQASYGVPLNRYGTELSGLFGFSKVHVVLPIKQPPDIVGKSYSTGLSLSQPLGADRRWVADVGLNWQRVGSYFDDVKTSTTDIRSLQAGLTYQRQDRWGRTFNRVQNTFAFGSKAENPRFWKVEDYFTRLIALPRRHLLILKAYGQFTPDALPAAQQFQLGGENSVRGFTEGLLIGDRGFNLGIEHRFPVPGLSKVNRWLDNRLQAAWFYDFGRVWLDRSNPTYISGRSDLPQRTLLQSAGVGLRAQITRFLQGYIDVGFGLGDRKDVEPLRNQPTARVHFGLRTDVLSDAYRLRPNPRQLGLQPSPPLTVPR